MGAQAAFVQHYLDLCRQSLQPVPTFEDTEPLFPIEPQQIKPDGVRWGAHTPSKIKKKERSAVTKAGELKRATQSSESSTRSGFALSAGAL